LIAGICIEKNISHAFPIFAASAAHNYRKRQLFYGHCFQNRCGIAQDPSSAVQNYRLAAQQRHIPSLCRAGVCLLKWFGARQNVNEAASLFADAAAQRFPSALYYRRHSF
jgi:TPR repeat protein